MCRQKNVESVFALSSSFKIHHHYYILFKLCVIFLNGILNALERPFVIILVVVFSIANSTSIAFLHSLMCLSACLIASWYFFISAFVVLACLAFSFFSFRYCFLLCLNLALSSSCLLFLRSFLGMCTPFVLSR